MILLFCLILWLAGDYEEAAYENWKQSERNKERRHRELIAEQKRQNELMKLQTRRKTVTRRRILKDERGRVIAEEVTVEGEDDE